MTAAVWLIPFVPAAGALVLILFGRAIPRRGISILGCGTVLASFVLSVYAAVTLLPPAPGGVLRASLGTWIASGDLSVAGSLAFDRLTAVMALVVTGVGFLIHVYSTGYMAGERSYARYFAHLNLFTSFMLVLVFAANLPLLFVGWEGVGLCSYLLIGFWFERPAAATAGMKAFLVNRVGDAAFIAGMLLLILAAGSGEFAALRAGLEDGRIAAPMAALGALLLFAGATGKSAQLPLHVWLPDAMEGPTPVSALIHAATMVTAGVYLLARLGFLFVAAPRVSELVAVVGAVTAVFAGVAALAQADIKRVLAYSTISQIGYMVIACGVGAFGAGIFHLFTHAFFKALLFLAAGSVIHALSGEQDLRRMGGLRRKLPLTYPAFLAGAAAIAGIPFLSGFFSKEAILTSAWASRSYAVWGLGLAGAVLTAAYTFRLTFLIFAGSPRGDAAAGRVHESPRVMTSTLLILAFFSITAGALGLPAVLGGRAADLFGRYLEPALETGPLAAQPGTGVEVLLLVVATAAAALGIGLAYAFLARKRAPGAAVEPPARRPAWRRVFDAGDPVWKAYQAAIIRPFVSGSRAVYRRFDVDVIDGAVNGAAAGAAAAGRRVAGIQTGWLKDYALIFLVGAVLALAWILLG